MTPTTLEAARRGDRQALGELITSLQDTWYRFTLSLLNNADLAADATQETALRFLRQLPGFRGESELKTWSLGIALNVTRELKRKRHDIEDVDDLAPATDPHDDPLATLDLADQRDRVREVLTHLSGRQREVILLRFFEELSTDQTAAAMSCAPGTVKATLHQALRALKARLANSAEPANPLGALMNVTDLRKQLDSARSEYLSHRYAGNLADEVLPTMGRGRSNYRIFAGAIAALAAAVLIYVGISHLPDGHTTVAIAPATQAVQAPTTAAAAADSFLIPQYLEIAPPAEALLMPEGASIPAMSIVPSWDDVANSISTSTTQESV